MDAAAPSVLDCLDRDARSRPLQPHRPARLLSTQFCMAGPRAHSSLLLTRWRRWPARASTTTWHWPVIKGTVLEVRGGGVETRDRTADDSEMHGAVHACVVSEGEKGASSPRPSLQPLPLAPPLVFALSIARSPPRLVQPRDLGGRLGEGCALAVPRRLRSSPSPHTQEIWAAGARTPREPGSSGGDGRACSARSAPSPSSPTAPPPPSPPCARAGCRPGPPRPGLGAAPDGA